MFVYTSIIGSKRDVLRPIVAPPDPGGRPVRYVCFTDITDLDAPPGWELRRPLWTHPDPRRTSRWHSTMAHAALGPQATHSFWLDATLVLQVNPWSLVDEYLLPEREMAAFAHPERTCVYQELEMCRRLRKDDDLVMRRQVDRYREEGYPRGNGLFEMAVALRKHTPRIAEFNEAWWREIDYGSVRDQLSVNYAAWKLKLPMAILPGHRISSPYFRYFAHQRLA